MKYIKCNTLKVPGYCYSFLNDYRILKFVFIIFALYFIFDTFYILFVQKPTYTSYAKREKSVEDFPEITICPRSLDTAALNLRGYPSPEAYYKGLFFGWTGNKSEDVKNVSLAVATLKSNQDCKHLKNHFGFFNRDKQFYDKYPIEFILTRALSPYHICCKVVPPDLSYSVPLTVFAFQFNNHSLVESYRVFMADKLTASIFDQNKLSIMLGDKLSSGTRYNGYLVYKVKIREDISLENDPHNPCFDYKIMGEYAQCVENEIIQDNFQYLNCTPPWMTEDEDLWCKGRREYNSTLMEEKHKNFVTKLGMIEAKSEVCSVPCKVKRYHAEGIGVREWDNVKGGLAIWFENEVDIVKASWKIDPESLISSVGGFIGVSKNLLWLIIMLITSVGGLFSYLKMQKFEFDLF